MTTDHPSPDEGVAVGAPGGPLGGGGGGGPGAQPVPPQPLFHPDDINVQSLAGLTPHLQINPQVGGGVRGRDEGEGRMGVGTGKLLTFSIDVTMTLYEYRNFLKLLFWKWI